MTAEIASLVEKLYRFLDTAQKPVVQLFERARIEPPEFALSGCFDHDGPIVYGDDEKRHVRVARIAQRLRPTVELAARAAGWTRTITEAYLAGSAVTVTAILAGKGLKSAADVFSDLARKHGSTMSTPACIEAPKKTPSPELAPSGPRVAPVVRDNGQVLSAMLAAMKEAIQHRIVMQTAGQEARAFGGWVQKNLPDLPIEERRHAQRAYAHILQALLSDNGTGPHQTDFAQAFLKALEKTKPKSGGLTSEYIKPVLTALRKFNNLASHGTSRLREVK